MMHGQKNIKLGYFMFIIPFCQFLTKKHSNIYKHN